MIWAILAGALVVSGIVLAMVAIDSKKKSEAMEVASTFDPIFVWLCFVELLAGNPRMWLAFALVVAGVIVFANLE